MMNDRFDAQLREHLLGTADTRPADGQLASIAQNVANTAQRHPLAARLTWFPGRVGPVATRPLRVALVATALVATLVAAAMIVGQGPTRSTVFEGTWLSTDPGDGSDQSLVVEAGPAPAVHFVDHHATGPACRQDAVKVFTAEGSGTVVGSRLDVVWPTGGGCGLQTVQMQGASYTYDQATDTIIDGDRLTWSRAPELVPPTRGPETSLEPTLEPEPQPTFVDGAASDGCTDVPAGSTYRDGLGPLTLTVRIPSDAVITWQASGPDFGLMGFCSTFMSPGGPFIRASVLTSIDGSCEAGDATPVNSAADAVSALASVRGIAISEPTSVTLAGRTATRFEIAPDAAACYDRVPLWDGFDVGGGRSVIYVIDVDGVPLALTLDDLDAQDQDTALAESEAIIASLQVDAPTGARPTSGPIPTPDPACIQLDGAGSYTAPVGRLSLTATLPGDAAAYWSGARDWFGLSPSPCGYDASVFFAASIISRVALDACKALGDAVDVATAAQAANALAAQQSVDVSGQATLTIDGRPAVRLQMVVPSELDTVGCNEGGALLLGQGEEDPWMRLDQYTTYLVHLVDVDGTVLAITAVVYENADADVQRQVDAVIGSLQIRS